MREIEIHGFARRLLEAHGAQAIAGSCPNAIELEAKGEAELARTWRHIEDAMKLMRGAAPKLKLPGSRVTRCA